MKHLFPFVILTFTLLSAAWAGDDEILPRTEKEVAARVEEYVGEVVAPSEAPVTYKTVSKIFERLSEAQIALAGDGRVFINRLMIATNEIPNSFVYSASQAGVRSRLNYVVVTTGLLELLFKPKEGENLTETLNRGALSLAGLLAHELARPLHKIDWDLRAGWVGSASAQAEAARADIDAVPILEKAGYPREALYLGLKTMFENLGLRKVSDLEAFLDNEHDATVRLSIKRLFLTAYRYQVGSHEPKYPEKVLPAVAREVTRFKKKEKEPWQLHQMAKFEPPASLREAIERLTEFLAAPRGKQRPGDSFGELYLMIDAFLLEGENLFEDEGLFEKFLKIQEYALTTPGSHSHESYERLRASEMRYRYPNRNAMSSSPLAFSVRSRMQGLTHKEAIAKIALFRSPIYLKWIRETALPLAKEKQKSRGGSVFSSVIYSMEPLLPAEVFFHELRPELVAMVREHFGWVDPDDKKYKEMEKELNLPSSKKKGQEAVLIFEIGGFRQHDVAAFALAEILHEEIISPVASDPAKLAFLFNGGEYAFRAPKFLATFFKHTYQPGERERSTSFKNGETPKWLLKDLFAPENAYFKEEATKVAERMWKQRGLYGALDFLDAEFRFTDWRLIWKLLGIDAKKGRRELVEATKEFMATDGYKTLIANATAMGSRVYSLNYDKSPRQLKVWWADPSLTEYVSGKHITESTPARKSRFESAAKSEIVKSNMQADSNAFRASLGKGLRERLSQNGAETLTLEAYVAIEKAVVNEMFGKDPNAEMFNGREEDRDKIKDPQIYPLAPHNADVRARAIEQSQLSMADKKALLTKLFADYAELGKTLHQQIFKDRNNIGSQSFWFAITENEVNEKVFTILLRTGILESRTEFFENIKQHKNVRGNDEYPKWHFKIIEANRRGLLKELTSLTRYKDIKRFAAAILASYQIEGEITLKLLNTQIIRGIKDAVVEMALKQKLTPYQRMELFELVTLSGPSFGSDSLLNAEEFFEYLSKPTRDSTRFLDRVLSQNRIKSRKLEIDLATRLLTPRIDSLTRNGEVSARDLSDLLLEIERLVLRSSPQKDEFLEKLAWKLKVRNVAHAKLIEDHKSSNWRKANPTLLKYASFLGRNIVTMSPQEVNSVIEYLENPKGKPVPKAIEDSLRKSAIAEIAEFLKRGDVISKEKKNRLEQDALDRAMRTFESFVLDASPLELIPLYDMLLNTGTKPMVKDASFPLNVSRGPLKFPEGSENEILLKSFLEVVPEHERTVTLAYLLSTASEQKTGVRAIFETFKAVGVKAAQAAVTWKLFDDPAILAELALTKDHAEPQSYAEAVETIEKTLSAKERARIKGVVRVLGSASLKTVVEVEMVDGSRAVIALRRPNAEAQIKANLKLAREFLMRLKANGLKVEIEFLETMISAVERQFKRELDFRNDAKELVRAKKHYEAMNGKKGMKGWSFRVPGLVEGFEEREDLLVMEMAQGKAFSKLGESPNREVIGDLLVSASLELLFKRGWFDADRHVGNQLIDEKAKEIWMIDFGQAEGFQRSRLPWKTDDAYLLSQFARALKEGNAERIAQYGLKMHGAKFPKKRLQALNEQLIPEISVALTKGQGDGGEANPEALVEIFKIFARAGVPFEDRFSFGAMKGLMTLFGENYVTPGRFGDILAKQVKASILSKPISMIVDACERYLIR